MSSTVQAFQCFKLKEMPATAYYVSEVVNEEEEAALLKHVFGAPRPKWTQLNNRRLQNWGGIPHPNGMIPEEIPDWLTPQLQLVNSLDLFGDKYANHVLINEYRPGQGIMPHLDGPLFYPAVATISLGSHTLLNFYSTEKSEPGEKKISKQAAHTLLLEPRSLVVINEDMYTKFYHGIEETKIDTIRVKEIKNYDNMRIHLHEGEQLERSTRISLTIRHVPKCSRFRLNI